MKNLVLFLPFILLLGCDSNDYQECYEPFFFNDTQVSVSLFYGEFSDDAENIDSIIVKPGDTTYNTHGGVFPFLHKEGLGSFESYLYDVRLEFQTVPKKCLIYIGEDFRQHDIRDFSSYEKLGPCNYCSIRGQSIPDGMLYRITDELLEQAEPCE